MIPEFFKTQTDFRKWLTENHETETEKFVGFYKIGSRKPSMTWSESVDQALCFGWIDGVTRSLDKESYCIRFTPRRANSIWSAVNIKKVKSLTERGLMLPAGLESFKKRTEKKSGIYAFENEPVELSDDMRQKFMSNAPAWEFYQKQAPSYIRTCNYWIMTAKQETTRTTRLQKLISASEQGNRL